VTTRNACYSFRHLDGRKHTCHRPAGHRRDHHADSGLAWPRHPVRRGMDMTDGPCPDCQHADGKSRS
jgi:hypothetical protein